MDLRVFAALGVYGTTAVTALTAQNTCGVQRVFHVPPTTLAAQIDAVMGDIGADAAKTGMLGHARTVAVVAERVRRRRISNLVVDPVLLAKDGTRLLHARAVDLLKRELLPLTRVVTPNAPEAAVLAGMRVETPADARSAAERIGALGVEAVVVKGGHLTGEPVDYLWYRGEHLEIGGERIEVAPVHGTGCIYSAALAARLAQGNDVPEACRFAKSFVTQAIRTAVALGNGNLLAVFDRNESNGVLE